jgi:hypothetical protein
MTGVVNVVYSTASPVHGGPVYRAGFIAAENIVTTTGASATTSAYAIADGVARVTSVVGNHYIGKPSSAAGNGAGWYLPQGAVLDLAGFLTGEKVTAVEAS